MSKLRDRGFSPREACLSVGKQLMVSMAGLMDGFSRSKPCSALGFPMFNVTLTKAPSRFVVRLGVARAWSLRASAGTSTCHSRRTPRRSARWDVGNIGRDARSKALGLPTSPGGCRDLWSLGSSRGLSCKPAFENLLLLGHFEPWDCGPHDGTLDPEPSPRKAKNKLDNFAVDFALDGCCGRLGMIDSEACVRLKRERDEDMKSNADIH